jgi:hypothetical protein
MTASFSPKRYAKLLTEYLPSVVETEDDNVKALKLVESLMKKGAKCSTEEKGLELLVTLVADFEEKNSGWGNRQILPWHCVG